MIEDDNNELSSFTGRTSLYCPENSLVRSTRPEEPIYALPEEMMVGYAILS